MRTTRSDVDNKESEHAPDAPVPRPRLSAAHLDDAEHRGRRHTLALTFHSPISPHLRGPDSVGRCRVDVENDDIDHSDNDAARCRDALSAPILPKTCANCGRKFFPQRNEGQGTPCKTTMSELLPSPTHKNVADMCSGECRWSYALTMRDRLGLHKPDLRMHRSTSISSSSCSSSAAIEVVG